MPMGNRKLFLMFLSAMTVSIIVMVIIYGLFIKDIDFTFNVRNPEQAPSPIDDFEAEESSITLDDSVRNPAKVITPDQSGPLLDDQADKTDKAVGLTNESDRDITRVIPLEPQVNSGDELPPPTEAGDEDIPPVPEIVGVQSDAGNTLHYVFLDGFSTRSAAEEAVTQLQNRKLVAQPYIRQHHGQIILQFGVFSDRENAEVLAQQLRNQSVFVKID